MQHPLKHDQLSVIEKNVSYYNEIAEQYDEILDRDNSNGEIRKKVAAKFCETISSGRVLDFGGGTGKDLDWLTQQGYQVIFCEPSVKMREKAVIFSKNILQRSDIIFLESSASDFNTWQKNIPFSQKADAILANFAVINSIPGISLLFQNLSLVIRPGGHLLMLVLKSNFKKRWRAHRRNAIFSLFSRAPMTAEIQFNSQRQIVHFYTIKKIKKAAGTYFHFCSCEFLKENDFVLIHLTRK